MANNPWTTKEDLALCESFVEAVCTPQSRRQGALWRRVMQVFTAHRRAHNRTVDALSSRFRVIRSDCMRFEHIHNEVEYLGGDIDETSPYKSFSSTISTSFGGISKVSRSGDLKAIFSRLGVLYGINVVYEINF
ncbi:hypothetical protein Hanom_Chr01g00064481 [Helianthus anomalus]